MSRSICKAAKWINSDGASEGWEAWRGGRLIDQREELGSALVSALNTPTPDPSAETGSRPWRTWGSPESASTDALFLEQEARKLDHAVISVKTFGFRIIACAVSGKLGDRDVNVWSSDLRCVESCIAKLQEIIEEA